jgi:hypothetical protein
MIGLDKIHYAGVNQAYCINNTTPAPTTGWKIVATSLDIQNAVDTYGLKSIVYQNEQTGALHFAFAGTDPYCTQDLWDDGRINLGSLPNKFPAIKELIAHVRESIGSEFATLDISCSGHSLGAVLSDLAVAELSSQGVRATSTTFDNPGSYKVIKNAIKHNEFSGRQSVDIVTLSEHATAYLAEKNFINSMAPQLAATMHQVHPNNQDEVKYPLLKRALSELWDSALTMLSKEIDPYLESKNIDISFKAIVTKIWDTACGLFGQVKSHSLANFSDLKEALVLKLDYDKTLHGNAIKHTPAGWALSPFREEEGFVVLGSYDDENNNVLMGDTAAAAA